jgi:transcriptional regulator with XRE-family HTH domain
LDATLSLGQNVRMADSDAKAQYEQEFIARAKAARIATGKKQWQVAELMGIKQDQYKHYETGRVIPHHLIGRFCLICSIDPNWLITGKGSKPLQATHALLRQKSSRFPRPSAQSAHGPPKHLSKLFKPSPPPLPARGLFCVLKIIFGSKDK